MSGIELDAYRTLLAGWHQGGQRFLATVESIGQSETTWSHLAAAGARRPRSTGHAEFVAAYEALRARTLSEPPEGVLTRHGEAAALLGRIRALDAREDKRSLAIDALTKQGQGLITSATTVLEQRVGELNAPLEAVPLPILTWSGLGTVLFSFGGCVHGCATSGPSLGSRANVALAESVMGLVVGGVLGLLVAVAIASSTRRDLLEKKRLGWNAKCAPLREAEAQRVAAWQAEVDRVVREAAADGSTISLESLFALCAQAAALVDVANWSRGRGAITPGSHATRSSRPLLIFGAALLALSLLALGGFLLSRTTNDAEGVSDATGPKTVSNVASTGQRASNSREEDPPAAYLNLQVPAAGWTNGPAVVVLPPSSASGTVRERGSRAAPVLDELQAGKRVTITGKSADRVFHSISYETPAGTRKGWMHRDILRPAQPGSPTPTPTTEPTGDDNAGDLLPEDAALTGATALGNRCYVLLGAERYAPARAACKRGLAMNPDEWTHGAILYNLGLIEQRTGNTAGAKSYYEESLAVRPNGPAATTVRKAIASLAP